MSKTPKARQLASHGPEVVAAARFAGEVIATAGPAYDEHWNELVALISAAPMESATKGKIIDQMKLLCTIRLVHLEAEKVIRDAVSLTISKAPEIVKGLQRKKGGREAGQAKKDEAEPLHKGWIDRGRKAIASGTAPRELSSLLAERCCVHPRTMRGVLQEAGLVPRRRR